MTEKKCNCVECRIRAALSESGDPSAPFEVDTKAALDAIGNVASEMLAHHSTKAAKAFAAELLECRKRWLKHPRVAAQQKPAGHA